METESLIQTQEVARKLKVSPHTIQKWRHEGKGPPYLRIGRLVRYEEKAVWNWLHSHCNRQIPA